MRGCTWLKGLAVGAVTLLASATVSLASTTIAYWSYNPGGNLNVATGTGTCSLIGSPSPNASYTAGSPADTSGGTNNSLSMNGWAPPAAYSGPITNIQGVKYAINTSAYNNIKISFDSRCSSTMLKYFKTQYSTDGGTNWIDSSTVNSNPAYYTQINNANAYYSTVNGIITVDLTGASGVSFNANFQFRIIPITDPVIGGNTYTSAAGGTNVWVASSTWRVDAVTFAGDTVVSVPPSGAGGCSPTNGPTGTSVVITVTTSPGVNPSVSDNPLAAVASVTGDLSAIGGAGFTNVVFSTSDNTVWTTAVGVDGSIAPGIYNMPVTVTDGLPTPRSSVTNVQFLVTDRSANALSSIKIAQVYPSGGNTGANWKSDYVVLYNKGLTPVFVGGWALEYYAGTNAGPAASSFANIVVGTTAAGTIAPGHYFLVKLASGAGGNGADLPTPDSVGSGSLDLSAANGSVALQAAQVALSGACADPLMADSVAYGSGAGLVSCGEGARAVAPAGASYSIFRANGGCTDTGDNSADFLTFTAAPKTSADSYDCSSTPPSGSALSDLSNYCPGDTANFTVFVTAGTSPTSTGLQVHADYSALGGGSSVSMTDTGGSGIQFDGSVTVGASTGVKTINFSITDAQGRFASASVDVTVNRCAISLTAPYCDPPAQCNTGGATTVEVVGLQANGGPLGPSTGFHVYANLAPLNGSPTQELAVTTGSNYAFVLSLPSGLSAGAYPVDFNAVDDQGRTATATFTFNIVTCSTGGTVPAVVISQVYGGGNLVGATYQNDYIELFNRSGSDVDLSTWSIQYSSATADFTGSATNRLLLTGVIPAHGYYLISMAGGTDNGVPLPVAADQIWNFDIANDTGKVLLNSNGAVSINGTCATVLASPSLVDLVGYGQGASCFEGIGASVSASRTASIYRISSGCVDGNQNAADFNAAAPFPRNTGDNHSCPAPCKPNAVTGSGCLLPTDLLSFLNLYFTNYDGFGSAVPASAVLPPPFAPGAIYAVPCTPVAGPPVVPADGLKADYDGDCQVLPSDLLTYLHDYFNPADACISGCALAVVAPPEAAPTQPPSKGKPAVQKDSMKSSTTGVQKLNGKK